MASSAGRAHAGWSAGERHGVRKRRQRGAPDAGAGAVSGITAIPAPPAQYGGKRVSCPPDAVDLGSATVTEAGLLASRSTRLFEWLAGDDAWLASGEEPAYDHRDQRHADQDP